MNYRLASASQTRPRGRSRLRLWSQ